MFDAVSLTGNALAIGAFFLPLVLSHRAIRTYTGFNVEEKGRVMLERVLFILATQSVPLYLLASFSIWGLVYWILALFVLSFALSQFLAAVRKLQKKYVDASRGKRADVARESTSIGIFHPHCHQRAGGEMVLWSLIKVLVSRLSSLSHSSSATSTTKPRIVIYSNVLPQASIPPRNSSNRDNISRNAIPAPGELPTSISSISNTLRASLGEHILSQAATTFAIDLHDQSAVSHSHITKTQTNTLPSPSNSDAIEVDAPSSPISFCFLRHTDMSDPQHYPRLTIVLQSFNAMLPMLEAAVLSVVQRDEGAVRRERGLDGQGQQKGKAWDEVVVEKVLAFFSVSLNTSFVVPNLIVDTAGYPFISAVCRLLRLNYGCYVHYPIISSDMLAAVSSGASQFNNNAAIAKSRLLTHMKLVYYQVFARIYEFFGSLNSFSVANGSWTQSHLYSVWNIPKDFPEVDENGKPGKLNPNLKIPIVYPPCKLGPIDLYRKPLSNLTQEDAVAAVTTAITADKTNPAESSAVEKTLTSAGITLPSLANDLPPVLYTDAHRLPIVTSLGQFRQEKNHPLQIRAFARALELLGRKRAENGMPYQLLLVGTTRPADMPRIAALRELIKTLDLADHVRIHLDLPRAALHALLARAAVGLHSMRDEHFGIGVVELLDAGLITVAHDSAGPQMDIVVPSVRVDGFDNVKEHGTKKDSSSQVVFSSDPASVSARVLSTTGTGYLAATEEEYARAMADILVKYDEEQRLWQTWSNQGTVLQDGSSTTAGSGVSQVPVSELAVIRYNARAHVRQLFTEDCFAEAVEKCILQKIKEFM